MEGRRNPLRKDIDDIVVGVSAIVELGAKRALPFLRGNLAQRVWGVKEESLELQLAHAFDARPYLEGQVTVHFVGIRTFDESDFRIEIWPNLPAFDNSLQPVRPVGE